MFRTNVFVLVYSRITAKAPYQANSSSSAPSKQANGDKFWLGLGREVAIKQEI
jgi:hypothetical protein